MRLLSLIAALLAVAAPAAARADDASAPATAAALFVELVVNGQAGGALVRLAREGGRLLVDAAELRAAGVVVRGADAVDVTRLAGARATYDAPGQRLLLDLPPALLPTRRVTAPADAPTSPVVDAGALLNYDLYLQAADGRVSASLWTEQRAFGRFGSLSNAGVIRTGHMGRGGYLRYDTRYRLVDEGRALELTAGDLITRALPWSTAVRIGGVQVSRDFAVRPDLVTSPLPSFAGEAAVPTGVDLFINGYRQNRAQVAPGRFVLESVPVVNGAGEARIVTTDAVGRQIATVIPFYVAPELLRPGLTDFSVELGALRRDYGLRSFGYARAVASASARRGVTARLTLSGHAEAARGMWGAGAGAAWSPGLWGALSGSAAASRARGRTGTQLNAGYTYAGRGFSFGAEHMERSRGFDDLGGFDLGRFTGSARSDRASLSVLLPGLGSVGAGYVASRSRDGERARLASASWSAPVGRRASAFGALDYDVDRRAVSAQLRLVAALGGGVASAGIARSPGGGARLQASLARTTPTDGGFGYGVDGAYGARGPFLGQATATWRARAVQLEAGAAARGGARSVWGSAAGSVAVLDGRAYLANALPGAFAIVATGMSRVPVYYENQRMGLTDGGGRLFVPTVAAHHPGRFAIDPVGLPLGQVAERTEARVTLRAGTGAVIRLPVAVRRSATARIVDAAGAPLAPGTPAILTGGRAAVVGWDGVIVIGDATGAVEIAARTAAGRCAARVDVPGGPGFLPDLGVVTCR